MGPSRGEGIRRAKAFEIYQWWRLRARAILAAAASMSREESAKGSRRSIFVLTQNFIRDDDLKLAEEAVEFAQRADTHMYFVDTRGLVAGDSIFGDKGREVSLRIDMAGAEEVAIQTGGDVIRDTNDLLGGLRRAVAESTYYYVLGYSPAKPPDNQWRKLKVKVKSKGVTVRARRAYFARGGG